MAGWKGEKSSLVINFELFHQIPLSVPLLATSWEAERAKSGRRLGKRQLCHALNTCSGHVGGFFCFQYFSAHRVLLVIWWNLSVSISPASLDIAAKPVLGASACYRSPLWSKGELVGTPQATDMLCSTRKLSCGRTRSGGRLRIRATALGDMSIRNSCSQRPSTQPLPASS